MTAAAKAKVRAQTAARASGGRGPAARVLGPGELGTASRVCQLDPIDSVMAAARIDLAVRRGLAAAGGEVWGWPAHGPIQAVCWVGANLVPVVPHRLPEADRIAAATAFAELARYRRRTAAAIVGERTVVLELWGRLAKFWPQPRAVRPDQPSMALSQVPQVPFDAAVRRAEPVELQLLFPACVEMFTEEIGYSPLTVGPDVFRDQLRSIILRGCAYLRLAGDDDAKVAFKAEVGVVAGGVAQVQGVWIPPHLRGRGLSAPALAAVVMDAQRRHAPTVSLYANAHNERALRCYRRVGFARVGTFATVLF